MKCQECRGACCETFDVPMTDVRPIADDPGTYQDRLRWIGLHGQTITEGPIRFRFACKCTALTEAGACGLYDDRPTVCRDMPVGGAECLEAVRNRRTPLEYTRIRDDDDPRSLHGSRL
jgi:Fe-S-cluster containining protein